MVLLLPFHSLHTICLLCRDKVHAGTRCMLKSHLGTTIEGGISIWRTKSSWEGSWWKQPTSTGRQQCSTWGRWWWMGGSISLTMILYSQLRLRPVMKSIRNHPSCMLRQSIPVVKTPERSPMPPKGTRSPITPGSDVCFQCHEKGHWSKDCRKPSACHRCSVVGHWMRNCPQLHKWRGS